LTRGTVQPRVDGVGHLDQVAELDHFINVARRVSRAVNAVLAEDGMREDTWRVLHLLARRPGLLMGEVAEAVTASNATVTRLVNELVDLGLVYRKPGPDDGRKALVFLSRLGQDRLRRVSSLLESRMSALQAMGEAAAWPPGAHAAPPALQEQQASADRL
jgi:DNA-binding MarR family transcriptional regulator